MSSASLHTRAMIRTAPSWAVALLGGLIAVLALPRGADWPAQLFRVELFRQEGFVFWNGHWYSGHPTASYSVLFPPLGAALGVTVVSLASVAIATVCFHLIVGHAFGERVRVASLVFGLGLVANLVVGRLTFALGVAIGLAALLALQRSRPGLAALLALATPLASPVAGAFLAVALAAWAADRVLDNDTPGAVPIAGAAALAVLPTLLAAVVFPSQGIFAFDLWRMLTMVTAGVVLLALARRASGTVGRPVAIGVMIYLVAAAVVLLIPNPLGGNIWRMAMFFAVPLAILMLTPGARRAVTVLAAIGLVWAWAPAAVSVADTSGDPSVERSFHEPLIGAISQAPGPPGRVEIPFTKNHWEAFYVAAELPLARGWERQADVARNGIFYSTGLGERAYRSWLSRNAVRWVALPRVGLDPSATAEAELLSRDPDWLRPVWSNADWQLWEVVDATPLVSEPATVVAITPSELVFDMPEPGWVTAQIGNSPHWAVADERGCVAQSGSDGVVGVRVTEPGRVTLRQGFFPESACE